MLRIESSLQGKDQQKRQQPRADDHVQRVHAGHREVNPVEHFDLRFGRAGKQVQLVRITISRLCDFRIERIARNQPARNQVVSVLVVILDSLDAQKRQTEEQGKYQTKNLRPSLSNLRKVNCQRHRETAQDQHTRVERSERDVQVIAG